MSATELLAQTPGELASQLLARGIERFWLVSDPETGRVRASTPMVAPLAAWLEAERRDFLEHEGLFFQVLTPQPGLAMLAGAFVHRTQRGQAAGGVRYWGYPSVEAFLRDGLRLAVGMTRKNALAGLWWGGGKGVIARHPKLDAEVVASRALVYRQYGAFISSLRGCYVTAEDVGTRVADMAEVFSATRFTTCIPPQLGGSGNPSIPTARGVVAGMVAALEHLGLGPLRGKTVAVQGLGNVGAALVGFLLEQGVARIIASDISPAAVEAVRARHAGAALQLLGNHDDAVLEAECDVLAPCATGAILNARTIPRLRARVVCGAANNQLEDPGADDERLAARGIAYVPDFLVNRMGIVTCADEGAGTLSPDPRIERHLSREWEFSIHQMTAKVLGAARASGQPPSRVATAMADDLAKEPHPIFGHRGRQIIQTLVANGWEAEK